MAQPLVPEVFFSAIFTVHASVHSTQDRAKCIFVKESIPLDEGVQNTLLLEDALGAFFEAWVRRDRYLCWTQARTMALVQKYLLWKCKEDKPHTRDGWPMNLTANWK